MKNLFFTFLILIMTACTSQRLVENSGNEILKTELTKISRMGKMHYSFSAGQLEESGLSENTKKLNDENWKTIQNLASKINLENINNLEAPTDARFTDRVKEVQLSFTLGDTTYVSSGFDEGNPPAELEEIYTYLEDLIGQ
ncbi:hypothetical protein [Moheibacter sp.]|uniref:hypothetical protein n=1 Tax=Moheibacter sp. TaxID=1965316 RepID=UPI003C73E3D9